MKYLNIKFLFNCGIEKEYVIHQTEENQFTKEKFYNLMEDIFDESFKESVEGVFILRLSDNRKVSIRVSDVSCYELNFVGDWG